MAKEKKASKWPTGRGKSRGQCLLSLDLFYMAMMMHLFFLGVRHLVRTPKIIEV